MDDKNKLLDLYADLIKLAYSVDIITARWIAYNSDIDLEQLSNSIYTYISTTYQEPERGILLQRYLGSSEVEAPELYRDFKKSCAKQKCKLPWLQFDVKVRRY